MADYGIPDRNNGTGVSSGTVTSSWEQRRLWKLEERLMEEGILLDDDLPFDIYAIECVILSAWGWFEERGEWVARTCSGHYFDLTAREAWVARMLRAWPDGLSSGIRGFRWYEHDHTTLFLLDPATEEAVEARRPEFESDVDKVWQWLDSRKSAA